MILIVGAGPCGLMMACELGRLGIATRLLETSPAPGAGSRAILLWPPSLEQYAHHGILTDAEKLGVSVQALNYHTGPRTTLRLPLTTRHQPSRDGRTATWSERSMATQATRPPT